MTYTNPDYLISTEQLAQLLSSNAEDIRVFDVTVTLVPSSPGYKAISGLDDYNQEHIPGAAFMDLLVDMSDTSSGLGFTLPSSDRLQSGFRKAGICNDTRVVFYSTGHMMWATRAWWMLHSCGHKNVAVLNGGFPKWKEESRAISDTPTSYDPGDLTVNLNPNRWTDKAGTLAAISATDTCTINALSPGVYAGTAEMHYGRRGHIENSLNVHYETVLENGCFRSGDELRELFEAKGVLEKPRVIAYCGGGISATIDALALSLIGHRNVAVYDGSMSEWVKDESLPLVLGED